MASQKLNLPRLKTTATNQSILVISRVVAAVFNRGLKFPCKYMGILRLYTTCTYGNGVTLYRESEYVAYRDGYGG